MVWMCSVSTLLTTQDILDRKAFTAELLSKRITVCVHLAAVADLNEAAKHPIVAERVNIDGTKAVLSCCDACNVRVLFASTCCVYGNNGVRGKNDELSPLKPTEYYAPNKAPRRRKLVLQSPRLHELKHVVMRLATFYGPGNARCSSHCCVPGEGTLRRCESTSMAQGSRPAVSRMSMTWPKGSESSSSRSLLVSSMCLTTVSAL